MCPAHSSANTLIQREILGNMAEIIEFETDSPDYDLKIWIDQNDGSSLREIMESVWGISGVTGVFQCPKDYSACGWKNHTINERYVNWVKYSVYESTGERVVFWWDGLYKSFIFQTDKINPDRETDIFEWLANHPLLLLSWEPMTDSYWEKGLIDEKMRQKWTRNFICSDKESTKIYFWLVHAVNIDTLAKVIQEIGCYNAINLDAGYSTAMLHNGGYLAGPGREILDWVFIVPKNIETSTIENSAQKISENIHTKLRKYSRQKQIEVLQKLILKISDYNQNIYDTRSENIYEQNSDWFWIVVGRRTHLSKLATEKVYLLNKLNSLFYTKIKEHQAHIEKIKKTPVFDLKF